MKRPFVRRGFRELKRAAMGAHQFVRSMASPSRCRRCAPSRERPKRDCHAVARCGRRVRISSTSSVTTLRRGAAEMVRRSLLALSCRLHRLHGIAREVGEHRGTALGNPSSIFEAGSDRVHELDRAALSAGRIWKTSSTSQGKRQCACDAAPARASRPIGEHAFRIGDGQVERAYQPRHGSAGRSRSRCCAAVDMELRDPTACCACHG